ncbi:hypothetical protein CHARACLAT_011995 [Characodon lateralis]|uniref:Uncharacterized protein n=1 Tax=Characodon lateralis TaxID=208331 RepID=A0ABU7E9D8_9TELE|nr:hypothetical protein [Characodon lateralis]
MKQQPYEGVKGPATFQGTLTSTCQRPEPDPGSADWFLGLFLTCSPDDSGGPSNTSLTLILTSANHSLAAFCLSSKADVCRLMDQADGSSGSPHNEIFLQMSS